MSMSKKDFIALADTIRDHQQTNQNLDDQFTENQIALLADFCQSQNQNFMHDRWLGYIAGTNGKNGGAR